MSKSLKMNPGKACISSTVSTDQHGAAAAALALAPEFPADLRILLVEEDLVCLTITAKMLRKCLYKVTTCETVNKAVTMILENPGWFHLVLSNVYMADTNSFKLLQSIGKEMDIPFIMMSSEEQRDAVLKGVVHGACDYLIKPLRMEQLQNIWQHVVRKRQREGKEPEQQSGSMEDRKRKQIRALEEGGDDSPACEGSLNGDKRKKDGGEKDEVPADPPQVKKQRFVWTPELQGKFLKALDKLGIDKAVPKKILELMDEPNITRDHVASHLQKHRANQKKNRRPEDKSNSILVDNQEMAALAGVDRFNFQAPPSSSPNLPQTLAAPQAGPSRTISSYMDMPAVNNIVLDALAAFASIQGPASVPQVNNLPFNHLTGVPDDTNFMQYEHSQLVDQPCRLPAHLEGGTVEFLSLSSSQVASFSFPGDPTDKQPNNNPLMVIEEDGQTFLVSLGIHDMDCQDMEMEDISSTTVQKFSAPTTLTGNHLLSW